MRQRETDPAATLNLEPHILLTRQPRGSTVNVNLTPGPKLVHDARTRSLSLLSLLRGFTRGKGLCLLMERSHSGVQNRLRLTPSPEHVKPAPAVRVVLGVFSPASDPSRLSDIAFL